MNDHVPGIWVVAADHRAARLMQAVTPTAPIVEVETIANPDAGASESELHRHSAGGSVSGATGRRTRLQPRSEGRKVANRTFAKTLSARLEQLRVAGALRRLHLVGEPETLGMLRAALTTDCHRLVASETLRDPRLDDPALLRSKLPAQL